MSDLIIDEKFLDNSEGRFLAGGIARLVATLGIPVGRVEPAILGGAWLSDRVVEVVDQSSDPYDSNHRYQTSEQELLMKDALHQMMSEAHARLEKRLVSAKESMEAHAGRREIVQSTDAFLVNACRHTAAVCDLVLPAARTHLANGQELVHRYVMQCKRSERAIIRAKQRMYGEAHTVAAPWPAVWDSVVTEVRALHVIEQELVTDLSNVTDFRRRDALAGRFESVADHSPTRPHPSSPHTGILAHVSRWLWGWADRFWDVAEGRIVSDRALPDEPEAPDSIAA